MAHDRVRTARDELVLALSVIVPLQLRPIVNRAQSANAAPASVSATPVHATSSLSGTKRPSSTPPTATRLVIRSHAVTLMPSCASRAGPLSRRTVRLVVTAAAIQMTSRTVQMAPTMDQGVSGIGQGRDDFKL
jgi:hypothetical protein